MHWGMAAAPALFLELLTIRAMISRSLGAVWLPTMSQQAGFLVSNTTLAHQSGQGKVARSYLVATLSLFWLSLPLLWPHDE